MEGGGGEQGTNNILDEGYIEDLKQAYGQKVNVSVSCAATTGDDKSMDYDPYSYVYDSKVQQMDLTVTSGGLCCGTGGVVGSDCATMPIQYGNNNSGNHNNGFIANSSSNGSAELLNGHVSGSCGGVDTKSENEYEEIRDVARYMNSSTSSGPVHFKSFSSTDDILAEVVQVQRGHDRVLDQLNLEVENLLISSSNEIEGGGVELKEKNLDKMSSLSLNGIYTECYCDVIPAVPQFGTNVRPAGSAAPFNSLSSGSSSKDSCCCCAQEEEEGGEDYNHEELQQNFEPSSRRSNSLILNGFNTFHPQQQQQYQPTLADKQNAVFASLDDTCIGVGLCNGQVITRKKKLEREPLSDAKIMFGQPHQHHHHLHHHVGPDNKHWKVPHHRSYSLIPNWKIREHLRRLPFLRQQRKFSF